MSFTANVILSLIDRMKGEVSPLPRRYSEFQAYRSQRSGHIALGERTEESARRAVVHFLNQLKASEAIAIFADITILILLSQSMSIPKIV